MISQKLVQILILIKLVAITQSCSEGCLRCENSATTPDNPPKCTICDWKNNFTLSSDQTKCEQSKIKDCEFTSPISVESSCLLCKPGMIFDSALGSCSKVPDDLAVPNCIRYQGSQIKCDKCGKGYYMIDGKCFPVTDNTVPNCHIFVNESQCSICNDGFFQRRGVCLKLPTVANCLIWSQYACDTCMEGYLSSTQNNFNLTTHLNFLQDIATKSNSLKIFQSLGVEQICQKIELEECLKPASATECELCKEDYILNSAKKCVLKPYPSISNCAIYFNLTTCSKCLHGYYLASNECKKSTERENCEEYHTILDHCAKCTKEYYLNNFECQPRVKSSKFIDNCEELEIESDECKVCKESFERTPDRTRCLLQIANCITYKSLDVSETQHKCNECEVLYYPSISYHECYKQNVSNCEIHLEQQNKCKMCKEDFYLQDGECKNQNLPKCINYILNYNKCSKCQSLYYLDEENLCEVIPNDYKCKTSNGVNKECKTCLEGLVLNAVTMKCGSAISINAQININSNLDQHTNNLQNANSKLTRLLSANRLLTEKTNSQNIPTYEIISEAQSCSISNKIYFLKSLSIASEDHKKNLNCEIYDPNLQRCRQCIPGYEFDSSLNCIRQDNHSLYCSQIKEGNTTTRLSENKDCVKCSNPLRFRLKDGSCVKEDHTIKNCLKYNSDFTNCDVCNPGFMLRTNYQEFEYNMNSIQNENGTNSFHGTLLFSQLDDNARICKDGFVFVEDENYCMEIDNVTAISIYLFENNIYYHPVKMNNFSDSSNCLQEFRIYDQSNYQGEKVYCTKCMNSHIPVISNLQNDFVNHVYNSNIGIGESFSAFVDCAIPHKHFSFNNIHYTDPELNVGLCGLGMKYEYYNGVACIRCPNQRMGKVMNMTNLPSFGTLTAPIPMLIDCQSVSDLGDFNVTGLDFHRNGLLSKTKYSDFINASKCSSEKYLIYFFSLDEWADLSHVEMRVYQVAVTESSLAMQYKCTSNDDLIPERFRTSCQIFVSNRHGKDSYLSTSEFEKLEATHCLACKPGYKAVVDFGSQTISSCEPIQGCDLSENSETAMNMCLKCQNGHSVVFNGALDFTQCVDLNSLNNNKSDDKKISSDCYLVDISSASQEFCRLCKEGFNLTYNGNCVSASIANCQNFSFGRMNIKDLKNDSTSIMTNSYLALKHKFKFIGFNSFCIDNLNNNQIIGFKDYDPGCFEIPNELPFQFPYDCKGKKNVYDRFKNCSSCMKGYTLFTPNFNTQICVPQKLYSFENMKEVSNLNNTVTIICEDGFVLLGNKCVSDNCKLKNGELCSLCQEGYVSIHSQTFCVPNPDPLSSCLFYSPILGHCVKCSQPKSQVIAFYYEDSNSLKEYLSYICSEPLNEVNVSSFINEYSFIKYTIPRNSTGSNLEIILSIDIIRHDGNIDRILPNSVKNLSDLGECINDPFPTNISDSSKINNCKVQRSNFCLQCDNNFGLTTLNTCVSKLSQYTCILFKNESTCLKCDQDNYIKESKCVPFKKSNCKKYNPETYECIECAQNSFFDLSTKSCIERKEMGCFKKNLNGTECLECNSDYYLIQKAGNCNSNPEYCNECVLRNFEKYQCKEFDKFSNQCLSCHEKEFYLNKRKGICIAENSEIGCNTCEKIDYIENCEVYHKYKDECLACKSGYYMQITENKKRCLAYNALGCKERLFGVDACIDCKSQKSDVNIIESPTQTGYFCPVKTPQNCKNFKNNKTQCRTCKTGFVLDETETTCLIEFYRTCQTMSPDLKKCQTCRSNEYNSSNQGCIPYDTTLICQVFNYFLNECAVCDKQRYYLNSGKCVQYQNISNCMKYSRSGQFCEECNSGYRIDLQTGKCVIISQKGCTGDNVIFNKEECQSCDNYDTHFKNYAEPFCLSIQKENNKCLHSLSKEKCLKCPNSINFSFYNSQLEICETRKKHSGCTVYDYERDICLDCLNMQNQFINQETKLCENRPNDDSCISYESIFSSKCSKCKEYNNYYLDTNQGKCLKRTKYENCEEYHDNSNECKLCSNLFYWNGTKCNKRSYTYCEIFNPTSDDCIKCNYSQFYYYDIDNNRSCRFRDNYGLCEEYHYTKSECTKCNEQSHYLFSGVCHKFEKLGCSGNNYDKVNNTCLKCDDEEKFFYHAEKKQCEFRTRTDCLEFDPFSDNCESCNSTFYYLMQHQPTCGPDQVGCKTCSVNFNSNCKVLDPFNNGCSECRDGMYLEMDNKKCHQSYGLDCIINESVQNDCFDCLFNSKRFNPFSVQCSHRSMSCNHCYSYKSSNCAVRDYKSDRCLLCPSGHWLNETTGSCQMGTSNTNCKTHDPNNSKHCLSCNEPFFKLVIDPECSEHSSNCFNICVEKPKVKDQVPECLQNTSDNLDCDICYDGYYLSKTSGHCFSEPSSCNRCIKYTVTGCKTYDKHANQCASCQGPYYQLKAKADCAEEATDCMRCIRKSTVGDLVPNCVNNTEESLDCQHCDSTSYLTKTDGNCYDDPPQCNTCTKYTIHNCLRYNLYKDQCTACDETKFNLKNDPSCSTPTEQCLRCVEKKKISEMVPACSRDNSNTLDCDACIFGYYMTITPNNCYSEPSSCNICRPYTLKNCKSYDQYKDQCLSCFTGLHYLKSNNQCSDGTSNDCKVCQPYQAENCVTFNSFADECDSCEKGYFKDILSKKCTLYTVENCEKYSQIGDFCTTCKQGYYFNNSKCPPNTTVENCYLYDNREDKCEQCETGYYVDQTQNICKENPTGPINCISFNEEKVCNKCSPNYFLTNDSKCQRVENTVFNCDYYSQDGICSECISGFILSNNQCEQAEVQNCAEYINKFKCKTCNSNYILDSTNSQCVFSNIDFCEKAVANPTPICEKCSENYIPSSDFTKCLQLNEKTSIKNCQVHSKERFCTSCQSGYYLVEGNYACRKYETVNTLEPKCVSVKESDTPFCTFCQLGFYMNESSSCVKCPQENCGICNQDRCDMCLPGSYMNPEFKCVGSADSGIRSANVYIQSFGYLFFIGFLIFTGKY